MEASSAAADHGLRWRLWTLVPIALLAAVAVAFAARGDSVTGLLGTNPPPTDEFSIRRVEFKPGEIRVRVTNPQREDLTVGFVTIDDAVVAATFEGPQTLGRLRSTTIVVPFHWDEGEPVTVGVTSSTGVQTTTEIAAAIETPGASGRTIGGYAIIGALVGILPIALGLAWLPSLRRMRRHWLAAFMAMTAGLLSFLAVEALSESLSLQAALPGGMGGAGLVLLGLAASYLTLTYVSQRFAAGAKGGVVSGLPLALLVAIGIGLHNLGEGLAIGSSFALGELALGTFLIVGFMVHNLTEGLAIAAPVADRERGRVPLRVLFGLAVVAGAPAIVGAWMGGFVRSDLLGVLFFALAAGAALQVVIEVGRAVARMLPGGLRSGWALGGFVAGISVMYATALIAG